MPENRGANRPRDKSDKEDAERLQRIHPGIGAGKEHLPEHQPGHRAVDQEIVPFDRRADRAGDDGAAQMPRVLGFRQPTRKPVCRGHFLPLHPCYIWPIIYQAALTASGCRARPQLAARDETFAPHCLATS